MNRMKLTKPDMKPKATLLIAMICWIGSTMFAQQPQFDQPTNSHPSFFRTVAGDVGYVFTSPLRMSTADGVKLALFSGITAGLILYGDEGWDEEFGIEGYHDLLKPLQSFTKPGKWYDDTSTLVFFGGLSAAMLGGGLAFRDHKLLETTRLMSESFVLTQLLMVVSKRLIGRSRPFNNEGATEFHLFRLRNERAYHSMPSSHTASIFSMMTVIAKQYPQWWSRYPAYAFGLSVALERADSRNHWASDILLGGAVGYCVGNLLVKRTRLNGGHFAVSPSISFRQAGVSIWF